MRDFITIGSSPCDEDCVQLGSPDYYDKVRTECHTFIQLLRNVLGTEPEGARLALKAFPHDFGKYHQVICWYEEGNQEALDYALRCESEIPEHWTEAINPANTVKKIAAIKEKAKERTKNGVVKYAKELSTMKQQLMGEDRDVECPYCGHVTTIELDAGTYWCGGCEQLVRSLSQI